MEIAPELRSTFPGLRVVELRLGDLNVMDTKPELESFKHEVQGEIRRRTASLEVVKDLPIFRAYRDFFWRVGIDPTKVRPAGEALTRKILGGRDLPKINTLVDTYNLASVKTSIAIAAFDFKKVKESALVMRRATSGELFHGIGMSTPDSLTGVEVVIEDLSTGGLIAVYPYRDSDDTKVTEYTKDVLFMMCGVPGIEDEVLESAGRLTREYVTRFCSSRQNP